MCLKYAITDGGENTSTENVLELAITDVSEGARTGNVLQFANTNVRENKSAVGVCVFECAYLERPRIQRRGERVSAAHSHSPPGVSQHRCGPVEQIWPSLSLTSPSRDQRKQYRSPARQNPTWQTLLRFSNARSRFFFVFFSVMVWSGMHFMGFFFRYLAFISLCSHLLMRFLFISS